jgi:hypothetical protein
VERIGPRLVHHHVLFPRPALPEQTPSQILRFTLTTSDAQQGLGSVLLAAGKGRPRIGIALAGGGAKAAASIGVLKVLHREGIPVDAIAGTSMGAIVGGFAAAGYQPDEIEAIFLQNDLNDLFSDTPSRAFLTRSKRRRAVAIAPVQPHRWKLHPALGPDRGSEAD